MCSMALLYEHENKDFNMAEKYYLLAVENGCSVAMYNLALLYEQKCKDFNKAEKYYLKAIDKNHFAAMINLANSYFTQKKNKKQAKELMEKAFAVNKDFTALYFSIILLWNNDIEEALNISKYFLEDIKIYEESESILNLFLLFLLAKRQYNFAYKLFKENKFNIKDRYKPVYYALMHFMKDQYPNEYKKMGSELKETVEEVIKEVKQLEIDYK